jgi:hypothetical protein
VPLSGAAQLLKPVVFKEGDSFCCLLGPDPQTGIFGCGPTPKQALSDWEEHLKEYLATADEDDYVLEYVNSIIAKEKEPKVIPPHVQAFYDQLRPVKKR